MVNLNTKLLSNGAKHIKIRSIGSDGKTESADSECIIFKNPEIIEKPADHVIPSKNINNNFDLNNNEDNSETYLNNNERVSKV
jgi:hypothetical protein